jgi:hypothetical protein
MLLAQRAMRTLVIVFLLLFGRTETLSAASRCPFSPWFDYHGTQILRSDAADAYLYVTDHVAIDADGAPNAYHPRDIGIDALPNAGYPDGAWRDVLVTDPTDSRRPFVQTEGPYAGYFVAMTTLKDESKPVIATERYVDATHVPYIVFPGAFSARPNTGFMGDLVVARHLSSQRVSSAVVADVGPHAAPLGEISIALAERLSGEPVNARTGHGALRGDIVYVVFRSSRASPAWPLTEEERDRRANERLAAVGGWKAVLECVATARMVAAAACPLQAVSSSTRSHLNAAALTALKALGLDQRLTQTLNRSRDAANVHGPEVVGGNNTAAVDISVRCLADSQIKATLHDLVGVGFIAWYRKPNTEGWGNSAAHIHAVWVATILKPALRAQVADWLEGKNGLKDHRPYGYLQYSDEERESIRIAYREANDS